MSEDLIIETQEESDPTENMGTTGNKGRGKGSKLLAKPTHTRNPTPTPSNPLKCPKCNATHTKDDRPFLKFTQVRAHYYSSGKGDDIHKGKFPFSEEDFGLPSTIKATSTQETPLGSVGAVEPVLDETTRKDKKKQRDFEEELETYEPEEPVAPSPDSLDMLATLLSDHRVKSKAGILRSMSLSHPENLEELQWSMNEHGVNKSRQSAVIRDFARWLGVQVPEDVIQELTPKGSEDEDYQRKDRWGRPKYDAYGHRIGEMEEDEGSELDQKIDQHIERLTKLDLLDRLRNPRKTPDDSDSGAARETDELRNEIRELKDDLAKERDRSRQKELENLKDSITDLKEEIKNQRGTMSEYEFKASIVDSVKQIFTAPFMSDSKPPDRKKTEGKSNIMNLIPEEYLEE